MSVRDRTAAIVAGVIGGRVRAGSLTVTLPDGRRRSWRGPTHGPAGEVVVRDPGALLRLATTGAIGFADAYIDGQLDTPDLEAVLELAALHLEPGVRSRVPTTLEVAGRALWRRLGRAREPRGPLTATVQHYDLGNDFYELWLDPTMTYSSAFYTRPDLSLEQAQREKYRAMARIADLRPGQRILEIGSGWGGFAAFAAEEFGARVTTTTISREQHLYVGKLVAERGLADLVEPRLEDFAETQGTYDRIVSTEMIESIPGRRWPSYFEALHRLLTPGGRIGLQVIWVADHHWRDSNENPDFIRRYVFPGAQVPSPGVLRRDAAAAGLRRLDEVSFGSSYARTLRAWRERFDASWPQIAELGFDERFRRMWHYYLTYCEAGFAVGRTNVSQLALTHA